MVNLLDDMRRIGSAAGFNHRSQRRAKRVLENVKRPREAGVKRSGGQAGAAYPTGRATISVGESGPSRLSSQKSFSGTNTFQSQFVQLLVFLDLFLSWGGS